MTFATLDPLALSYLESDEVMTFGNRIKELVEETLSDETTIMEMAEAIQEDASSVGLILRRVLGSSYTQLLLTKDKTRDSLYKALRDYVKSETNRMDEPVRVEQAKRIYTILVNRGLRLYTLGYTKQSAALTLLFEDLGKPEAEADLRGIEAEGRLETLTMAQKDFEDTFRAKITRATASNVPLLKEGRSKLDRSLMAFLTYVDFNAERKGVVYATIASQVNELIVDLMAKARTRQTLEKKAKERAKKEKAEDEALEKEQALKAAQAEAEALAAEAAEAAARALALAEEVPE